MARHRRQASPRRRHCNNWKERIRILFLTLMAMRSATGPSFLAAEEESPEVEGAFNAIFYEEQKLLTLVTDDTELIAAFGLERCGLVTDEESDISADGCAGWRPVAECGADHDLLMLTDAGGLRFGERPADNDMCTADRRPTSLTPAVAPN
ncbi:MAG: hypothetical protein AAFQ65_08290 [Myxococcota bacterium]